MSNKNNNNIIPNKKIKLSLLDKIKHNISTFLIDIGRGKLRQVPTTNYKFIVYDGGTAQRTYFMDRNSQKRIFLRDGYIEDTSKNYGLVKKAVNNRNIPIYQRAPDDEKRENLIPVGNLYDRWYGKEKAQLIHAGSYPTTIYINPNTNKLYQKAWDLNDYGDTAGTKSGTGSKYKGLDKIKANLADLIGSPVVVTSGISEIGNVDDILQNSNNSNNKEIMRILDSFYKSKGLKRFSDYKTIPLKNINGNIIKDLDGNIVTQDIPFEYYSLPEVVITAKHRRKALSKKY